jgi:hypothetical protein
MTRTRSSILVTVAASLILGACDETAPAGPTEMPGAGPALSFANAPSTPNVYRTEDAFVFGIPDVDRALLAWVGLPEDPTDAIECGGTLDFDLVPIQNAGMLGEAFNVLALSREVHIHLYDLDTFTDTCVDTPLAVGTGRVTMTDNDALNAGPGANSFGPRVQGTVTYLSSGETARFAGQSLLLNMPDGSFRVAGSQIHLTPLR